MVGDSKEKDIFIFKNQVCPACTKPKAVFSEYETEDPYLGPLAIFSVKCENCGYKSSDVEVINKGDPKEYILDVENKDDLNIRIIKSSSCEIIIPNFRISVDSSFHSDGFVSNVEGVLMRFKEQIEFLKEDPEIKKEEKKKLKRILNDINEVLHGYKKIRIILRDREGNSAIISDKVKVKKLK